jgi:hypothetical protein
MPEIPNDHDLLIELRTEMRGARSDIADMRSGLSGRLLNLEANAVSKIQFDDHEKRIRTVEKQVDYALTTIRVWGSVAVTFLGLLEVGLHFLSR